MPRYIALTGCAGFIGRVVLTQLLERGDYVYGVDALTYAADPAAIRLAQAAYPTQFSFVGSDVRHLGRLPDVETVIHCAAETHVDNSLTEGPRFVETNVSATVHLLEMIRAKGQHVMPRLVHVSTDEVYGSITEGTASVSAPLRPSSPYAASKAAADLLVQSWGQTYGVSYTIVRPTNCYGVGQYPEKLIPKAVRSLMLGRPFPLHGEGTQTRYWLWVEDCARALLHVVDDPTIGMVVNVGGNTEASVQRVLDAVGCRVQTGFKRAAMDGRYAVDDAALRDAGWTPQGDFWRDLAAIVEAERDRFRF